MPFATVQNQRIHYSESRQDLGGRKPALVLIHGAGGNLFHWPPGLRRLPNHDVYALDLPGHGRSQAPGRDDIGAYAEFLRDWADVIGLERFVLAGHSMGGAIAQMFALRYPRRLVGMILVGTGARLRVHPDILHRIRTDPKGIGELLVGWVHGQRASEAQRRQYLRYFLAVDTDVMYGDWLACDRFDLMEQLSQITLPTLIIAGSQDQMTPLKYAKFMAQQLPDADLTVIEGAGHMMLLEQPLLVTSAISGFLDRLRQQE
ncbi:MAG: alpha/beta hydrolase [Chloroflexi bacterium]|nr:alpha/beta hydrolase [Chloroflexota bacterium]